MSKKEQRSSADCAQPTVVWTRPASSHAADAKALADLPARVLYCPAITIATNSAEPPAAVAQALSSDQPYRLIVTSRSAALALKAATSNLPPRQQSSEKASCHILTFSRQVVSELSLASDDQSCDWQVERFAECRTGKDLAHAIVRKIKVQEAAARKAPRPLLIFAGAKQPAFDFGAFFRRAGLDCLHWPLYDTEVLDTPTPQLRSAISRWTQRLPAPSQRSSTKAEDPVRGTVVLCSPSAVRGFIHQWQSVADSSAVSWPIPAAICQAVVIGPTTAEAAKPYFADIELADKPTVASIIEKLSSLLPRPHCS